MSVLDKLNDLPVMEDIKDLTYEELLDEALDMVDDRFDKREGSIIFDGLAPASYLVAMYFHELVNVQAQGFIETASGEALDYLVAEQGIQREKATKAIKKATFTNEDGEPISVGIGSRFKTKDAADEVNYTVVDYYRDIDGNIIKGEYKAEAEVYGVVGNSYMGELIPISYVEDLAVAMLGETIVPAQDDETDDRLRERYMRKVTMKPFGGNIAQYEQDIKELKGVGNLQVYPTWDGGGTVLLSIVDTQNNPISDEFIKELSQIIDPENHSGKGLGLAPIGHHVTVTTPKEVDIVIEVGVTPEGGVSINQLSGNIEKAIEDYIERTKANWGKSDDLNNHSLGVFISQITAATLSVSGVANVPLVKLNGETDDLLLEQSEKVQEIPKLIRVDVYEVEQ